METNKVLELLKENRDQILNSFELDGLGIFGSYANNVQQQDSDIDILVFPKEDTVFTFKKRLGLERFMQKLLEINKIDIVNNRYINPIIKNKAKSSILYV